MYSQSWRWSFQKVCLRRNDRPLLPAASEEKAGGEWGTQRSSQDRSSWSSSTLGKEDRNSLERAEGGTASSLFVSCTSSLCLCWPRFPLAHGVGGRRAESVYAGIYVLPWLTKGLWDARADTWLCLPRFAQRQVYNYPAQPQHIEHFNNPISRAASKHHTRGSRITSSYKSSSYY